MFEDLEKREFYGVIIAVAIVVFFAGVFIGGDLVEVFRTDGEEPTNGDLPIEDSIEMDFESLYLARSTVQEEQVPDPETGDTETEEVETEQEIWIRESGDAGIDFKMGITQDGEPMMTQIYNHLEERIYMEQMGQWFYDEMTIEELEAQGFATMVDEFEDIAGEYDEGDQYEEEDPQTGEKIEWNIQRVETDEGIDDEKFTPPEDADPQPMQEQ